MVAGLPKQRRGMLPPTSKPYDLQQPGGDPPAGYPYKDGPLPDAQIREPLFSELLHVLHANLDWRSDALVSGDTFIYFRDENDRRRAMAPDCFVAFGPDIAQYRNRYGYSVGEIGKAPDFVMEVASPSTRRADLGYKRDGYHWIGVGEYWLFDPEGGHLYGQTLAWERLVDGEYVWMPVNHEDDGMVWAFSPALGLSVCVQGERVRLYDQATGEYWRSLFESEADRRQAEAARLDAENRAAAAEAEAQRLRELVQRLKDGPAGGT